MKIYQSNKKLDVWSGNLFLYRDKPPAAIRKIRTLRRCRTYCFKSNTRNIERKFSSDEKTRRMIRETCTSARYLLVRKSRLEKYRFFRYFYTICYFNRRCRYIFQRIIVSVKRTSGRTTAAVVQQTYLIPAQHSTWKTNEPSLVLIDESQMTLTRRR